VPAFALPWGPPIPAPETAGPKPKAKNTSRTTPRPARTADGKPAAPEAPVDWSALLG
jgi:molybdopterin molybdotransferase